MEDKGCFLGLFAQMHLGINSLSLLIRSVLFFLVHRESTFFLGNLCPAFKYKGGGQRVHLHFLKCLPLKIINKSEWHIWGCHVHLRITPPRGLGIWGLYPPSPKRGINSMALLFCHMHRAELTASWEIPKDVIVSRRSQACWHGNRPEGT